MVQVLPPKQLGPCWFKWGNGCARQFESVQESWRFNNRREFFTGRTFTFYENTAWKKKIGGVINFHRAGTVSLAICPSLAKRPGSTSLPGLVTTLRAHTLKSWFELRLLRPLPNTWQGKLSTGVWTTQMSSADSLEKSGFRMKWKVALVQAFF